MTTPPEVKILVGFDGSDDGQAALRFAADEAQARGGKLTIVYAVDDTALNSAWGIVFDVDAVQQAARELLVRARDFAHGRGVPLERIETRCEVGQPAAVLSKLSESASLAVVGRRAESNTHAIFVGSTAVGLAGTSLAPVVVTSDAATPAHGEHHAIGVGLDPAGHGLSAVEWALKRARRLGARVYVTSVLKKPSGRFFAGSLSEDQKARAVEEARRRIQSDIDDLKAETPGVYVELDVRFGSPVDELITLSRTVDLLIIGVHPSFPTYSVGGIVRGLMAHAACTLGLIRHR